MTTTTTTPAGTIDRDQLERQIRRAAAIAELGWSAETRKALESAYRRGFSDAEDSLIGGAADAEAARNAEAGIDPDAPDSTDSVDLLSARSYAEAAARLERAAEAMRIAGEAARIGKRNLAIGTALGAEVDLAGAAKALADVMTTIART